MNAAARPLRRVKRTTWSAPWARATSPVRSVEPSSTISTSTRSMPGIDRGMARSVSGSEASSLRHGIWTISFMVSREGSTRVPALVSRARAAPPRRARRSSRGTASGCREAAGPRASPRRARADTAARRPPPPAADGPSAGVRRRNPSSVGASGATAATHSSTVSSDESDVSGCVSEVERQRVELERPQRGAPVQVQAVAALERRGAHAPDLRAGLVLPRDGAADDQEDVGAAQRTGPSLRVQHDRFRLAPAALDHERPSALRAPPPAGPRPRRGRPR